MSRYRSYGNAYYLQNSLYKNLEEETLNICKKITIHLDDLNLFNSAYLCRLDSRNDNCNSTLNFPYLYDVNTVESNST